MVEKAIEPGGRGKVLFDVTFPAAEGADPKPTSTTIRAAIDRADLLNSDNQRLFAARVTPGVQVLIVDGDPATEPEKAERYFLQKALAPLGEELTPFRVQWRSDSQFDDGLPLEGFQLIFLCNVYRISDEQLAALDKWVQSGGGLVVALGDRVDGEFYNEKLYAGGKGLLPIKLDSRQGDETQNKWVNFMVDRPEHPLLRAFEGAENAAAVAGGENLSMVEGRSPGRGHHGGPRDDRFAVDGRSGQHACRGGKAVWHRPSAGDDDGAGPGLEQLAGRVQLCAVGARIVAVHGPQGDGRRQLFRRPAGASAGSTRPSTSRK